MSIETPKYGEVFRWQSETQDTKVMFIAHVPADSLSWYGATIAEGDLFPPGDVDRRIDLRLSNWSEIEDAS